MPKWVSVKHWGIEMKRDKEWMMCRMKRRIMKTRKRLPPNGSQNFGNLLKRKNKLNPMKYCLINQEKPITDLKIFPTEKGYFHHPVKLIQTTDVWSIFSPAKYSKMHLWPLPSKIIGLPQTQKTVLRPGKCWNSSVRKNLCSIDLHHPLGICSSIFDPFQCWCT